MIELTRLNNKAFFVNCDLIEIVEETPDTVISLTNGKKMIVVDSADDIISKIIAFRYRCYHDGHIEFKLRKEESV